MLVRREKLGLYLPTYITPTQKENLYEYQNVQSSMRRPIPVWTAIFQSENRCL